MDRFQKANIVKKGLIALFIFVSLALLYIVFYPLRNLSFGLFFYDVGRFSGLMAFVMMSFLIFLGDTARYWDKIIGLDKTIVFNKKFSFAILLFALIHPISFIISSKSFFEYIVPDFAVLPLAIGVVAFYIFIGVMIASSLYKRISYAIWQYIHVAIYFLFFFILYHGFKYGSDSNNWLVKGIYLVFLLGIIIGIIYRTSYKIRQRSSKFTVKEVRWETKDTFTLILKQHKKIKFKAGQFCFLRLNKNKLYARHPFTISSSPNDRDLSFTIKLQGRFTKTASQLKEGEEVIIEGPFGTFTIEDDAKDIVLLAGGVGITPFMSMIKDHLHNNKSKNIILLYGSKTKEDIIFKKELDRINEKWFMKKYILSNDDNYHELCENGYIDKAMIKRHITNIDNARFYVCGPEPMKECVKKALGELRVHKQNIIIEDFFW
ncbi:MAG: Sulfhydrogenase 2 subunit gamma [Candidatus Woesearchaeota archaeon]|nr:Sulfhydrogenase 2 subunit gamma [Candidatus Woesearchaeota archaeon]